MRILIFVFALIVGNLSAQKALDTGVTANFTKPLVEMTFEDEAIDLGQVKRGEKREFEFKFENTGSEAIEIEIVSGCDCTTLNWPSRPIKPGETGVIKTTFDSTEKEESETVDVDITLLNTDKKTGRQIFKIVTFKFELK